MPPGAAATTVTLPLGQTRAAFRPSTLDAAARTIELTWTTGARVRRTGWDGPWLEELSLEDGAVELARLNNGASLLAGHNAWGLEGIIGVVESAWLTEDAGRRREGRAKVRLSGEEADAPIVRKIQDGLIRHVSVGYITHEAEELDRKKGQPPVYRATRWEPVELSLVAVPADAGAQVRSDGDGTGYPCVVTRRSPMDDQTTVAERPPTRRPARTRAEERPKHEPPENEPGEGEDVPPPVPAEPAEEPEKDAAGRAAADERKRVKDIRDAVRAGGLPDTFADRFIDDGTSIADTRTAVLAALARKQPAVSRSVIEIGTDGLQRLREGMFHALLQRIAPSTHAKFLTENVPENRRAELLDAARDWHGRTLMEMGRACLEAHGARLRGVGRMELAAYALGLTAPPGMVREGPHGFLTTSDYPSLLATVGRAQLTAGYTAAGKTFPPWTRQGTLPDFRPTNKVSLGIGPKLLKIQEHGEYTRTPLTLAAAESMRLDKYGRILAFTREAMINDDVGLFNRIPTLFGNAAAAMESDAVYSILTTNPLMADGFALFSAQHGNLMTPSVIDVKNVSLARTAMMNQKSVDGQFLSITPRFMITGPAQEVYMLQFLQPITIVAAVTNTIPSTYQGLIPVVDPRITDNAWYLAADPNQIDTIEYDYLEGAAGGGPTLETREGWDIDGQEYKAREEFAAKALDYRGLVKNPGTLPAILFEASAGTQAGASGTSTAPAAKRGREE
jgi:hypothetical protein